MKRKKRKKEPTVDSIWILIPPEQKKSWKWYAYRVTGFTAKENTKYVNIEGVCGDFPKFRECVEIDLFTQSHRPATQSELDELAIKEIIE